jgi:uncharacterized damage-inducible protein DinB
MLTVDVLGRLNQELAYNAWANRETLRSLLAARDAPERAAAVMAHLVAAEWLWLRRLGHPSPPMEVWPALPLAECEGQLRELSRAWQAYLAGQTPESLGRPVRYTNSKGEEWTNTAADVLTHVVLHASYHRGQIASLLGRAGEAAAYSDYIEFVRRGYLERGWPG